MINFRKQNAKLVMNKLNKICDTKDINYIDTFTKYIIENFIHIQFLNSRCKNLEELYKLLNIDYKYLKCMTDYFL